MGKIKYLKEWRGKRGRGKINGRVREKVLTCDN